MNPDGSLRIEVTTAYNFIVDSNVETPATYAPRAAYITARIWNDGSTDMEDVTAYVGDGGTNTPGVYPSTTWPGLTGTFSLTHVGGDVGTADAIRSLGTIPAGEYIPVYWLVSYPNLDDGGNTVAGGIKPDDDLMLEYSIWAEGLEGGSTTRSVQVDRTATMRNCISAMANKIFPNTANKVPQEYQDLLQKYEPEWTNVERDGSPGTSVLTEGIWYDLGNVGQGFDNNGDLVPDQNAWLQPVGDPSLIDPSAFRLVNTYAMIVVKLKSGGELVYDVKDQLYFEGIPDNNGVIGLVRYDFRPLKQNASATLTPYQMAASGFDNEKFNGDYGVNVGTLTSGETDMTLTKVVDKSTATGGETLAYTVDYGNNGTEVVGDPDALLPLLVRDTIPPNTTYVGGSAATGNTLPSGVSAYTVYYSTDNGASWTTTEPGTPADVTDLEWWLSDEMAAGTSGQVTFSVQVVDASLPVIPNTVGLAIGRTTNFLEDDAQTLITGTLNISGTVFEDDGAGATDTFGNGIQDSATEVAIPNVTVALYYDVNNDDQVDDDDLLVATDISDVNGDYSFINLPAGDYVVQVDRQDADIPSGFTNTNPTEIAVSLSATDSTGNDFGFAPTLQVVKTGTPGTIKEGDTVTYTIDVINQYPSGGFQEVYSLAATSSATGSSQGTAWTNPGNALALDGVYATAPYQGNLETLDLIGFNTPAGSGTITSVDVVFYGTAINGTFNAGNVLEYELFTNGTTSLGSVTNFDVTAFNGSNYSAVVANFPGTFTWAQLSNLTMQLRAKKTANPGADLSLDAAFLRITSTVDTTLSVVPLADTYNADELTFVSAIPGETTTDVTGSVGTLTWANIGPIAPGATSSVTLEFTANDLPDNQALTTMDLASVTGAEFSNGDPANDGSDDEQTDIIPEGTIGDTIFFDVDMDGLQDANDPGVSEVTVFLYEASDLVTPIATAVTDANGLYSFDNLDAGNYEVHVDTGSAALSGAVLTSDPDSDGEPCTGPLANGCDSIDAVTLTQGQQYAGADFGYFLPGGVLDGTLWVDFDDDGVIDASETVIPFVTVTLTPPAGVDLGNGEGVAITTITDENGYYSFGGLPDGTYTVTVTAAELPAGLSQTYDFDATLDNETTATIASANSATRNFGYRYPGDNNLSGTVGMDGDTPDGLMGSGPSGVDGDETAFADVEMFAYLWNDDGDGTVEAGETQLIGTTLTDSNGDYAFTGLPEGDGDDSYLITMTPPIGNLALTTTALDTGVDLLVETTNSRGYTVGAYQALAIPTEPTDDITNIDFAFQSQVLYDFGDLPSAYSDITLLPNGARHVVKTTPDLYLGAGVTTETNGTLSTAASADANDDGVAVVGVWANGNSAGNLDATVVGGGYLVGYVDFNQDGDFLDDGELVVSQAASDETVSATFDIPSGTFTEAGTTELAVRFRILSSEPFFPELAFSGEYANGEVEDYLFAFNSISGTVYEDTDTDTLFSGGDTPRAGVEVTLLEGSTELGKSVTDESGFYSFSGIPDGGYTVEMAVPFNAAAINDQDAGSLTVNGDQTPIVLAGASVSGQDFLLDGNTDLYSVSGTVFFDSVDDDVFSLSPDDDTLQGMTITLYRDLDGDGVAETNEDIASTVTGSDGTYSFTGLPNGNYIVTMGNNAVAEAILDVDGSVNGDDLIEFSIADGDVTGRDFLTDGATTPQFCIEMSNGALDGEFIRNDGESGITYELEYTDALGNPTVWDGTVVLDGTNTTAATNGDGTETVTVADLSALTGLGSSGFVRLLRTESGTTLTSNVSGWVESQLPNACRTYSNPFLSCSPFRGIVQSVSGQELTFSGTLPDLSGASYYIEVVTGDNEGQRFDISGTLGTTMTLSNDSGLCGIASPNNTLTGTPPANLQGDSVAVHMHRTLATLFPMDVLTANADPSLADQVTLWNGSTFDCYYLDDESGTLKWVLAGDATRTDAGDTVVPPGHGSYVTSRTIKTLTAYGQVRENAFVRPLCQGDNLVSGGYPVTQTPAGRDMTLANGFTGSPDYKFADQFLIWRGDNTTGTVSYNTYYLVDWTTLQQWTQTPDYSYANQSNTLHFLRDRASLHQMTQDLFGHGYASPWAP